MIKVPPQGLLQPRIEVAVTWFADYTEKFNPRATVLFPWSSPAKLADPATLPTGDGYGVAWSPNGEFLAVAHDTSPYLTIYQTAGTLPESGIVSVKGVKREGD